MDRAWRIAFLFPWLLLSPRLARADFETGWLPTVWGPLSYRLYVPSVPPTALLVALHGCQEDGAAFAGITRLNSLAEQRGAAVLYPEQDPARNWDRCWNWFLPWNQARDTGEPAMIGELAARIAERWRIPRARTFVLGISAGGAMAAIVASCYPDRFSAVAIHSGLEYKAATDLIEAETTLASGSPHPPADTGRWAAECAGLPHSEMRLILFQGSADRLVSPVNADQLLEQFAWANGIWRGDLAGLIPLPPSPPVPGGVPGGYSFTFTDYGGNRPPLLRKVIVRGLGHAWSGGPPGLENSDPKGPDATRMIWEFFRAQ